MPEGSEDRVVRSTSARDELEEWALVLASAGIAHRVQGGDPGWQLLVEDHHGEQAEEALAAYDAERGAVVALRNSGLINDDVMNRVQRDIDLEASRLDVRPD